MTDGELTERVKAIADDINNITDIYDFIANEVLDYEYIINSDKSYRGVRLFIGLGGPTIWIDTLKSSVNGTWGTDKADWGLNPDIVDSINDYFNELWTI